MNLEDKIANLSNPQEFNHLCDVLFAEIYGEEYEQIDDNQKDGGNDGFVRSIGTFYARHCFKNLQKASQKLQILEKAKGDLQKAEKLNRDGKYLVKKWLFVTSYRMPNDARVEIEKMGRNYPFRVGCVGPAYIASRLNKNPHLLKEFGFLQDYQIHEQLESILRILKSNKLTTEQAKEFAGSAPSDLQSVGQSFAYGNSTKAYISGTGNEKSGEDYQVVINITNAGFSQENEKKLKTLIYVSNDQVAVLQGVIALVSWYKFSLGTVVDIQGIIDLGVDTARGLGKLDAEAVLLCEKATNLSVQFCLLDLEGWGRVKMSNVVGLPLISEGERDEIISRLKRLNQNFSALFKEAAEKSVKSNNYLAMTRVFSSIGSAAAQRAEHFKAAGLGDRAELEARVAKAAFMSAKSLASYHRDEVELAYILYNFSNALGALGEVSEALGVLNKVTEIAKDKKMTDILENIPKLEELIRRPKMQLSSL